MIDRGENRNEITDILGEIKLILGYFFDYSEAYWKEKGHFDYEIIVRLLYNFKLWREVFVKDDNFI